jgi:fructose-1,6-bisphosphatase/inositol monophosphatase family enzyme
MTSHLSLPTFTSVRSCGSRILELFMVLLVREGMLAIREFRHDKVIFRKADKAGSEDFALKADKEAQKRQFALIREVFSRTGYMGEEADEIVEGTDPDIGCLFVLDPACGTKAIERGQSNGIASNAALVIDDKIVATAICDAMSGDVYYADATSSSMLWIDGLVRKTITPDIYNDKPLSRSHVVLIDAPEKFNLASHIYAPGKVFKSFEVLRGSASLAFAKLWKGEVGAIIASPGTTTPWDAAPIEMINSVLGFVAIPILPGSDWIRLGQFEKYGFSTSSKTRDHDVLYVHSTNFPELESAFRKLHPGNRSAPPSRPTSSPSTSSLSSVGAGGS